MNTAIWVTAIIMSPFILVAVLLFTMGTAALAGATFVMLSEAWANWRERKITGMEK